MAIPDESGGTRTDIIYSKQRVREIVGCVSLSDRLELAVVLGLGGGNRRFDPKDANDA